MTEIYELIKMDNNKYFAWRLRNFSDGSYKYLLIFTNQMPFEIGLSGIFKFDYLSIDMNKLDWEAIAPGEQLPTNITMAFEYILNFINTTSA